MTTRRWARHLATGAAGGTLAVSALLGWTSAASAVPTVQHATNVHQDACDDGCSIKDAYQDGYQDGYLDGDTDGCHDQCKAKKKVDCKNWKCLLKREHRCWDNKDYKAEYKTGYEKGYGDGYKDGQNGNGCTAAPWVDTDWGHREEWIKKSWSHKH